LIAKVIDFSFLTAKFDTADFHDFFLEGFDFGFDTGGFGVEFIHISLQLGDF
jgi:hypothetical protein